MTTRRLHVVCAPVDAVVVEMVMILLPTSAVSSPAGCSLWQGPSAVTRLASTPCRDRGCSSSLPLFMRGRGGELLR